MKERDDLSGGKEAVEADPCITDRRVVDLLVQQVELSNVTIANKVRGCVSV